jgi:hypothetical protein
MWLKKADNSLSREVSKEVFTAQSGLKPAMTALEKSRQL